MENKNKGTERTVESIETKQQSVHRTFQLHKRARDFNYNFSDVSQRCLEKVMEVLAHPEIYLIGVYGSLDQFKDTLLEKVRRRVHRDKLFGKVLTVTVTEKPDVKKIQEEIARQIGLTFNHKSKDERAQELIRRIRIEQRILIVLRDLHKGFDLSKVGIPCGAYHKGCKILLTSTTEDVLSNQMHTQINLNAGF